VRVAASSHVIFGVIGSGLVRMMLQPFREARHQRQARAAMAETRAMARGTSQRCRTRGIWQTFLLLHGVESSVLLMRVTSPMEVKILRQSTDVVLVHQRLGTFAAMSWMAQTRMAWRCQMVLQHPA